MNKNEERLRQVRRLMEDERLDVCIIPVTDPHMGEYIPDHWRSIEWLTGFSGSAATVVITRDFAGVWTDSRYFIQGEEQLRGSGFTLVRLKTAHTPEFIGWLKENIKQDCRIGFDGRVLSSSLLKRMREELQELNPQFCTSMDLIGPLWEGRPLMSDKPAFDHDIKYAGISASEKIEMVRARMRSGRIDYQLLTSPEDIMWLLNIRAGDVAFSPLLMCYALLTEKECLLFAPLNKIPASLSKRLDEDGIALQPYEEFADYLEMRVGRGRLLYNPQATSVSIFESIEDKFELTGDISIPTRLKAVKNKIELSSIRQAMVKDGVALTRFFAWLERTLGEETVTELSAAGRLEEFRREQEGFLSPSFGTISAVNEHAALPHYTPTEESDVPLEEGIYLLDSGGQYLDGTTDITRTIALSIPTADQKREFTLALKGMIGLTMAKFPAGTRGYQIEALARQYLWQHGLNYGHGTGHGVGFCLNVHEGPQTIGSAATGDPKVFLEPGMLMSVEPAFYREGKHGFRTENLVICKEDCTTEFGTFNSFETVSLCHIDTSLIDFSLLSPDEKKWLNSYHQYVYEKLSPLLQGDDLVFLKNKTELI